MNYYCKNCGTRHTSLQSLTAGSCLRHPLGANKGRLELYEGGEKPSYSCKHCGTARMTLGSLTEGLCIRHPAGPNKARHSPAL